MLFSGLLVLLASRAQAGFYGFVFIYTTKDFEGAGYQVVRLEKFSFASCAEYDSWFCGGSCSYWKNIQNIDGVSGEWCQTERLMISDNTSLSSSLTDWSSGGNWTDNRNGISSWYCVMNIELRSRSDIGKPNSSPQTTTLPALRVPSNCQRNISLLTFDPDGDEVKCRNADGSLGECIACTPPSVLSVFPSCTLSFSPTTSSNEGPYAVQLMMEDFPLLTVTLTDSSGVQEVKTTSDAISKIPIQFVLKVDPAVPSCSEGLYLPRFLPPTPENGALIFTAVNQLVKITIRAEATQSVMTELLFSGPYNVVKSSSGSGTFTLTWTPSPSKDKERTPICFVIQANYSGSVYQSEQRCVVVTVGTPPPLPNHVYYLRMKITTTMSLEDNKELIETVVNNELIRRGILSITGVGLLSDDLVEAAATAPPSG